MIGVVIDQIVAWAVVLLVAAGLVVLVIIRPAPRRLARSLGYGLGGLAALFLVGRAVAEFFTVDYSNPGSYRNSWGGPSLVGVFLVHAGPGAAIVVAVLGYTCRWWPRSRKAGRADNTAEREANSKEPEKRAKLSTR